MRKCVVNHKILSVNDCFIIVIYLFISIVTTNDDSPSFLLRVPVEATMPQRGMAWKATEENGRKRLSNPAPVSGKSCPVYESPLGPLQTLIFHCWNDCPLSMIITPMYSYCGRCLRSMFVSSNSTVKRSIKENHLRRWYFSGDLNNVKESGIEILRG